MTLSLGWLVGRAPLTIREFTTLQSDPRDLWPLRDLIRVMRRHDLTKKDLPTYLPTSLPTSLENTIQELVCQWHFHFSCIWAAVLFYTFDIYRIYALLHLIWQIFVPHFWPLFLTLIFNPHFLSSFFTLIFHPHFLPSFLTIGKTVLETWHLRHWLHFWQLRTWIQTIILTWQLIVTLDSIRNSCDVWVGRHIFEKIIFCTISTFEEKQYILQNLAVLWNFI